MKRWAIFPFLFPFLYITAKALSHHVQDIFFSKAFEDWKTKHKRTQWTKEVAGAPINHGDNLYTVLWPITASLEQEFHLDLPWRAPHPPKKRCNHCKFICKVYGLPPQTCPFCSHEGNVWRNKWWWTLRRQMLHISMGADTAAQGQRPREGEIPTAFRINYTLIADLRCATFRTFSVCLISEVLAASRGAQLLQMLSVNSQIPLSVLFSAPTDVSWTTWVRMTHGNGEKEKAKCLRMIKRRVHPPVVIAAALFMLGNDGSLNTATINFIQLHPNTNLSEICFNHQHVCF